MAAMRRLQGLGAFCDELLLPRRELMVKGHEEFKESPGEILVRIQPRGGVVHILRGAVFNVRRHRIKSAQRMWSSTSLTAPSSGRHSCFSKSDCSWALALTASIINSCRVRNASLQTSQYAVFGVLPMKRTILSLRSGMTTSWQRAVAESNHASTNSAGVKFCLPGRAVSRESKRLLLTKLPDAPGYCQRYGHQHPEENSFLTVSILM